MAPHRAARACGSTTDEGALVVFKPKRIEKEPCGSGIEKKALATAASELAAEDPMFLRQRSTRRPRPDVNGSGLSAFLRNKGPG